MLARCAQIIVTEVGDETFIIAAIMAMRHPRLVVYAGAMTALIFMTVRLLGLLTACFFATCQWSKLRTGSLAALYPTCDPIPSNRLCFQQPDSQGSVHPLRVTASRLGWDKQLNLRCIYTAP